MGLTKFAVRRPLSMLMVILLLVVFGIRSYTELQIDRYPAIDIPYVSVITVYPGASPEDVETQIIEPIEDAVAGIAGVDSINSSALENVGAVVVAFQEGINGDQAASDVQRIIASIRGDLPEDADEPSIVKADINAAPIMELVLTGPQGPDELYDLADNELKPQLQAIQGVASVVVAGGREAQIQVNPDPAKLAGFGLPIESIQQALTLNNMSIPAGSVSLGIQKTSVRSVGELTSLKQIENVVVSGGPSVYSTMSAAAMPGMDTGGLVTVRDVATVQKTYEDRSRTVRYNGIEGVRISIVKTTDANTVEVTSDIRSVIGHLQDTLPIDAQLAIVVDDSQFVKESVAAVLEDLALAVLITGVIMLLFLHNLRSTLIVILAIPTSLISTLIIMWAMGYSLNVLTLLALTLTIGILVDDSIVVLENAERHLKMGKSPKQAALEGLGQIAMAAVTITLVNVAVYLPITFSSGLVGMFMRSYGVTIASAILFSLFISFTLTPMLSSLWMRDESQPKPKQRGLGKVFAIVFWPLNKVGSAFGKAWDWGFDLLARGYGGLVGWALKNAITQTLVILVAVGALAAGGYLVIGGAIGTELIPSEDDNKITITLDMPPGTDLDETDETARQAEAIILEEVPETVSILTDAGSSGNILMTTADSGSATLTVVLTDKSERERSTVEVIDALRPKLQQIPSVDVALSLSSLMGSTGVADVSLDVTGQDADVLADLANQVEAALRSVPGTVDVQNKEAERSPEAKIIIDHERALDLGLSPAQIGATLRTSLTGTNVGELKRTGDATDLDIILRLPEHSRDNLNKIMDLPVGYMGGQTIKLSQVAYIEQGQAPGTIRRVDRKRSMSIESGVKEGHTSGDILKEFEDVVEAQVDFPPGYGYKFSGLSEKQGDVFAQLYSALLMGIAIIYILLVFLFESWTHPLAIMVSLPVAVVGSFGMLWLTGYSLNMMSMMGLILVVGIVTKNAILLVDFTNELRREHGYGIKPALVEAGRLRLRPILMTTFALVFAMLPILLGQGAGAESRAPLAAVVIGGNVTSTLLTLIVVPVVYNMLDVLTNFLGRLVGKKSGDEDRPSSEAGSDTGEEPGSGPVSQPSTATPLVDTPGV